jgi:hypothetical protein
VVAFPDIPLTVFVVRKELSAFANKEKETAVNGGLQAEARSTSVWDQLNLGPDFSLHKKSNIGALSHAREITN